MKLAWSRRAVQELHELRRYSIERWGRDVALRYIRDVRDAALNIAANPATARALTGNLRIVRVRSHVLILHIDEEASRLTVARVLHAAMDIPRHLR